MNDKKAKIVRKIIKFKPHEPRTYETVGEGTKVNTGLRLLYQTAKKHMRWDDAKRK